MDGLSIKGGSYLDKCTKKERHEKIIKYEPLSFNPKFKSLEYAA